MDPSISKRQRRGDPRTTRRDVIEDSADASPCPLCARDTVRNMRATAKQRGCEQSVRQKDCEVCSEKKIGQSAASRTAVTLSGLLPRVNFLIRRTFLCVESLDTSAVNRRPPFC